MRFWDSSALVPLIVTQPASALADAWLEEDADIAIWTMTPVEIASAVHRLVREGSLKADRADVVEGRVDQLVAASHVVIELEGAKAHARRLLRVHVLRSADALQQFSSSPSHTSSTGSTSPTHAPHAPSSHARSPPRHRPTSTVPAGPP